MSKVEKQSEKRDQYVVTGKECPLSVADPKGGPDMRYDKGDKFFADEWPAPKVTIPNAVASGLIKKVGG